ncbi:MAG: hypothetical protein MR860_01785 [Prevotella sp.]|nr:hypothetical protein [Prevotella sp.]
MEYWVFSKKELNLISDMMIGVLKMKPDNSELSVIDIFKETLHAEFVEWIDEDGWWNNGLRIADMEQDDGKYLHDLIRWDFDNAVWYDIKQGFELYGIFIRKAIKAGFVIDASMNAGLKLGLPWYIQEVYRNKVNLLASFQDNQEIEIYRSPLERYYIRKRYETCQYHQENVHRPGSRSYDKKKELQLWRIPVGCSTGVLINEDGRVTVIVMKGKCLFEKSCWSYYCEYIEDTEAEEATWHENVTKDNLIINQSGFSKSNSHNETEAPHKAWYKMTNTGKSDLLVYVVDANRAVTIYH